MSGKDKRKAQIQQSKRRSQQGDNRYRDLLLKRAKGLCFKCLTKGHRIKDCRSLSKCLLCGGVGHKARWCTAQGERREGPSAATSQAAPGGGGGSGKAMEAPGFLRQGIVRAAAPHLAEVAEMERDLSRHAVVAVVVGYRPSWEIAEVQQAFAARFRVEEGARDPCIRLRAWRVAALL